MKPISFWRYSLGQELLAMGLAIGLLAGASWLTLRELNRRYFNLYRDDADRVQLHLKQHLDEARHTFSIFPSLSDGSRKQMAGLLFGSFSDLYQLDRRLRVVQIYKQQPGSRVFLGFSFAGSRLSSDLNRQLSGTAKDLITVSSLIRGSEDETASVYMVHRERGDLLLLGRVNLAYIQNFLNRFASITGSPLLLVSSDGFVMLTSHPKLPVASIDLKEARATPLPRPIVAGGQEWLPLVARRNELGSQFVSLVPTQPLNQQRQVMGSASLAIALLLIAVFAWKTLKLYRNLFAPFHTFAEQLRGLETSSSPDQRRLQLAPVPRSRFQELRVIQQRFDAMVQAINQREDELRQALRGSLAAAAIGHEINQPLTAIRLLCQQARLGNPEHGLMPLLSQLDNESQRVATTVERMRMLLRNVQTKLEWVNLAAVALSAITFTRHQRRELGADLDVEGVEGASLQATVLPIQGDPVQLQIAVSNLLRNAAEALQQQPVAQRRIRLSLHRHPGIPEHPFGLAELEVADSGPGLTPQGPGEDQDQAELGDALGRRPLHSTKADGSGLGLFVVRTTLEQHGGWLTARRCGRLGGASISLWLPLCPSQDN